MSDQKVGLSRGSVKDKQFIQDSANNYIVESFIDVSEVAPGSGLPAAVDGQQYLVDVGVSGILGGWGSIAGLQDKDIIRYKASQLKWEIVFSASADEEGGKVYDKDSDTLFTFDGTDWNVASGAGGGVKNFAESLVASYKIANFETGNNAVFGTAGTFGGALSQEKVAPLDGKKSFKYVSGAASGDDWFYLLVDISEYARGGVIGFTFDYTWDGDEDIRVNIWDPTFTNEYSTELNLLKNTTNDNKKSRNSRTIYAHPDTETQVIVGFQINSAEASGKTLIFDNLKVTDDIGTIGSGGRVIIEETYFRGDVSDSGTGSANTYIGYFGIVEKDTSNELYSVDNSSVDGLSITALKEIEITLTGKISRSGGSSWGFSKNADGLLSSPYSSVPAAQRIGEFQSATGDDGQSHTISITLKPGDVLRVHSQSTTLINSTNDSILLVKATAQEETLRFLQVPNGEKLKDVFSAFFDGDGTLALLRKSKGDFLDMSSSSKTGPGAYSIAFKPGFFSVPPIVTPTSENRGNHQGQISVSSVSVSGFTVLTRTNTTGAQDTDFGVIIHRTEGDNAPDIVGVPVSIQGQTHEADSSISVSGPTAGSGALTLGFTTVLKSTGSEIVFDGTSDFTVQSSGVYTATGYDETTTGGAEMAVRVNGVSQVLNFQPNTQRRVSVSWTGYLVAGDVITFYSSNTRGTGGVRGATVAKIGTQPLLDGGVVITDEDSVQNVYSARINNNGTASIVSESHPFIESAVRTALGQITVTLKAGFFTVAPSVTATVHQNDSQVWSMVHSVTSSSFIVETSFHRSGVIYYAQDQSVNIVVQRQGSDTKKLSSAISAYSSRVYKEDPIAYQTKTLNGITSAGIKSDLTFNNLELGQKYRIFGRLYIDGNTTAAVQSAFMTIRNNGVSIQTAPIGGIIARDNESDSRGSFAFNIIFTATGAQLEADFSTVSNSNSTVEWTLEELPFHSQTTKFS